MFYNPRIVQRNSQAMIGWSCMTKNIYDLYEYYINQVDWKVENHKLSF